MAPLKTLCGLKDHHVMGEDPNEAFLLLRTPGTCAQGGAQEPLVTGDGTLDLGALTVDALEEAFMHRAAVARFWPFAPVIAAIDRDRAYLRVGGEGSGA